MFVGGITGVTRFGLFVMLRESGGSGIVPISSLPSDYYDHDEHRHSLVGRRWGRVYRLGETVAVRLVEAKPITGGLTLQLIEDEAAADERIMAATPAPGRPRQRATKAPAIEAPAQATAAAARGAAPIVNHLSIFQGRTGHINLSQADGAPDCTTSDGQMRGFALSAAQDFQRIGCGFGNLPGAMG